VIGWLLAVSSAVQLIFVPFYWSSAAILEYLDAVEVSGATAAAIAGVGGVVGVVSGVAILKGLNWGRLLYLLFVPIIFPVGIIIFGFRWVYLLSVIFYIAVLVLLTRPNASAFFRGDYKPPERPASAESAEAMERPAGGAAAVVKRGAAVILLVIGGFLIYMAGFFMVLVREGALYFLAVIAFFGAMALVAILAGIWLWSWSRWRMVLGVVLTSVGGFLTLAASSMFLIKGTPEWQDAMGGDAELANLADRMMLDNGLLGTLLLAIGVLAIMVQVRRDRG
jgi:hypothetical protein